MNRNFAKVALALGLCGLGAYALADGWEICIDPNNTAPYSIPYGYLTQENELIATTIGTVGTVTYGSQTGPCFFAPGGPVTANVVGRIGFMSGNTGSIQSSDDDHMMYTFGMPFSPANSWSTAHILKAPPGSTAVTNTLWNTPSLIFIGLSNRYVEASGNAGTTGVLCHADVIGDGVRVIWKLTNQDTAPRDLGLWYGAWVALLTSSFESSGFGDNAYIVLPGKKPVNAETRFIRAQDPQNFPSNVKFVLSQARGYGMQVDLGPTPSTSDNQGLNSDATLVDEIAIGSFNPLLGGPYSDGANVPDQIVPDRGIGSTAFLQKYQPANGVAVGGSRTIIQYIRDTWGNSRYSIPPTPNQLQNSVPSDRPFSTVVDAPHILLTDTSGGGTNGLQNNPFNVRVYVDNVGGYTLNQQEIALSAVHVRLMVKQSENLTFTTGTTSTRVINGETWVYQEKTIPSVAQRAIVSLDWGLEADGVTVGDLAYRVEVTSTPGPSVANPMVINGTIRVAATTQLGLEPSANLVAFPWNFSDTSLESILGLDNPSDFTAYNWSPSQNSYVPAVSAARGVGTWIIYNSPSPTVRQLNGASAPSDTTTGGLNVQLKNGWNLIGNPYQYAFPLGQFVGVSAANGGQSFTFSQLVNQGIVSAFLAYWDADAGTYRYIQGVDAMVQPNRGYWIKVLTSQDLTLSFPAIYDLFVPDGGGFRAQVAQGNEWAQSTNHWRLNIQAQRGNQTDEENYVGAVNGDATLMQIPEPPLGPAQAVNLTVLNAANSPMAQVIRNQNVSQEWPVKLYAKQAGAVTLRWPNMTTVPSNVKLTLVNSATGQSIDMRTLSSVTVNMSANQTRDFKVKSVVNNATLPTIESVSASNGSVAMNNSPIVKFTLNSAATATVQIKNASGQLVSTLAANQACQAGENIYIWNLRSVRGITAGTYSAYVTATVNGQSMSKMATFSVSR